MSRTLEKSQRGLLCLRLLQAALECRLRHDRKVEQLVFRRRELCILDVSSVRVVRRYTADLRPSLFLRLRSLELGAQEARVNRGEGL